MKKEDDGKLAEGVRMAETLDTLGTKVDELSASIDELSASVDKRFEDGFTAVAVQFAEQRAYTEFAYAQLEKAMTGRLLGLEKTMTGRFDRLESKLDQVLAVLPMPRRRKSP